MSEFDLSAADLSGAWLADTNFTGAWLYSIYIKERTKLIKAFMEGANFSGVILNYVNFHGVEHLKNANFTKTQIIEADFSNTILKHADFTGAYLAKVKISNASLKEANLTDSSLLDMYGLRQWQINDAFRWKKRYDSTFITSAEGFSLERPPVRERPPEKNGKDKDKDEGSEEGDKNE